MTDSNRAEARARGQALRTARVARARTIRRRIIAGSVALFVAAWLMITLVLASGHDPALAKRAASSSSSATTVAANPTTSSSGSASSSQGSGSTSSGSSGNSGVSSVTTSQS